MRPARSRSTRRCPDACRALQRCMAVPVASGLAQVDLLAEAVHTAAASAAELVRDPPGGAPLAPVPAPAVPVVTGAACPAGRSP